MSRKAIVRKELDGETGLYYYGARYYDPVLGRFITVDPAAADPTNPQSWNRYAYCLNNPYKYVDPDGEVAITAILLGAWAVAEFALSCYDAYDTANTVLSPETSLGEKGAAVGLAAAGVFLPGGGYSKIDDVVKAGNKTLRRASKKSSIKWDQNSQRWRNTATGQYAKGPKMPKGFGKPSTWKEGTKDVSNEMIATKEGQKVYEKLRDSSIQEDFTGAFEHALKDLLKKK